MAISKDELQEFVEELENYKARATELITVYIPAGQNIYTVADQLEAEKSTAKNIKSTSTRKNVGNALDKITRALKDYKKTPENGLALFCGNISRVEGQEDLQIWSFELSMPLKIRMYRCDKEFILEPLREMLAVKEVFGLLVMDRKEATIGLLVGKRIELLQKMTSGVPSKVRAGGQCLAPETLIVKDDGDILEIKHSHNPLMIISENFNKEETERTPLVAKWENNKELFKVLTCYPQIEIKASGGHTFFVRTENGIEEKPLYEIKEGDYLIMPEKIEINNSDQELDSVPEVKQSFNMKKINLPNKIDPSLARLFGYYLGDGSYKINRITFFEQRKDVAEYYKTLIKELFDIASDLRFRASKNYWQLRIYSRIITQLFKRIFQEKDKTLNERIPSIILKSSNKSLASFIIGFFDAEGYVNKNRVALGINNEILARQIQLALLRLEIISSINTYDNRINPYSDKVRYTLAIDDLESLKNFKEKIQFASEEKRERLENLISKRSSRNKVRQLVVNGKDVARILRNSGLNTRQFNCPDFFNNKRQMSKEVFKSRILDKVINQDLKRRLEMFYNSNLIAVKISKIENIGFLPTIDIETKSHNFLANGILVHNSSQRFHRITEGLTRDFYKRIAEEMKNIFYEMPKLAGILVGGPIPTKDEFLDGEYLATKLREKVMGRIDLGDTSESGLKEIVEKSRELLVGQEIVYEKKVLERFFQTLGERREMATLKEQDTRKALEFGAVETLILSKALNKILIKDFLKLAENIGSKVELVSIETEEGQQFNNLGGIGAILRFRVG